MSDHTPFLRTIAAEPENLDARLVYADWLEERGDVRGEYIRLALELERLHRHHGGSEEYWREAHKNSGHCRCEACNVFRRLAELLTPERRREWTMLGLPEEFEWSDVYREIRQWKYHGADCYIKADFARGMPEILTLRFEEWDRHHKALIAAMPVREVRLTTLPDPLRHLQLVCQHDPESPLVNALAAEIPGPDPAHPIRYTLPQAESNYTSQYVSPPATA